MRESWKPAFTVGAVLLFVFILVLSACSTGGGEESQPATEPAQTEQSASEPSNADTSSEEEPKEEIIEKQGTLTVTIYDRGRIPAEEGTYEDNRWTKWINENFPYSEVKFVAIPRANPEEKLNVLFASGSAPDFIIEFSPAIRGSLYNSKQMMPVEDLINEHSVEYKALTEKYPELIKLSRRDDGKLYEMARYNELVPGMMVYIREDWLQKLNLQRPQTMEELFQVAKAFAENDPDGDNQRNTFGINISHMADTIVNNMFGAHAIGTSLKWDNGKAVTNWEGLQAATEFKSRLYRERVISQDFLNDTNGNKALQDFVTGKLGIYIGNYMNATQTMSTILTPLLTNVPDAVVTELEVPESPLGDFTPTLDVPVSPSFFVNANSKNPVAAVKYMDFLLKESTGMALKYGLEGVHYVLDENGCPALPADEAKANEMLEVRSRELVYTSDYILPYTTALEKAECKDQTRDLDVTKPDHKQMYDILTARQETFRHMSQTKEYPGITFQAFYPAIPQELQNFYTSSILEIENILTKAILDSGTYSADQAIADAKAVWANASGETIEAFYTEYFQKTQNNLVSSDEIMQMMRKANP